MTQTLQTNKKTSPIVLLVLLFSSVVVGVTWVNRTDILAKRRQSLVVTERLTAEMAIVENHPTEWKEVQREVAMFRMGRFDKERPSTKCPKANLFVLRFLLTTPA